jgi:hypothetical protein
VPVQGGLSGGFHWSSYPHGGVQVSVFTAQIDEFIRKSQVLTTGVVREAAQSMIEEAQTSRFKGGKMPRVTGFLTNSGKAQIGSLPSGESRPPPGYMAGEWRRPATGRTSTAKARRHFLLWLDSGICPKNGNPLYVRALCRPKLAAACGAGSY